ncbi:MAG: LamG domain-containing protein, partial [Planctomycetota bacterium]
PSTWPYQMEIEVKPDADGVIAMQGNKRFGLKLFVQDGRPGMTVLCKSWIAVHTTIDGPQSILGKWTHLKAEIDYNRVVFTVDGKAVQTLSLPQPFKYKTKSSLFIGSVGEHAIYDKVPHSPFRGEIRTLRIQRELSSEPAWPDTPANLFR